MAFWTRDGLPLTGLARRFVKLLRLSPLLGLALVAACATVEPRATGGADAYRLMPPISRDRPAVDYAIGPLDVLSISVFREEAALSQLPEKLRDGFVALWDRVRKASRMPGAAASGGGGR